MSHIGIVIRTLREKQGLTRQDLAKNICTEKYVYLIEKGERTPSADILKSFNAVLRKNLFSYFEFLCCKNPVETHDIIIKMHTFTRNNNFKSLIEFNNKIRNYDDFQKPPWKYYIILNDFVEQILVKHEYKKVVSNIKSFLKTVPQKYMEDEYIIKIYILLSTCYQHNNKNDEAKILLDKAEEIVFRKNPQYFNDNVFISVLLNKMTFCHFTNDFDSAIKAGLKLMSLMDQMSTYQQSSFAYYYLAYAYYKKGCIEEALEWFEKCLYELLLHKDEIAAYYIKNYNGFESMFQNQRIPEFLRQKFANKYKLIQW